jgi:hypothetical protein
VVKRKKTEAVADRILKAIFNIHNFSLTDSISTISQIFAVLNFDSFLFGFKDARIKFIFHE